ncbi:MAG: hypothetical protein QOI80_1334 [Solirubrobacteraceae bacterium]|nr:hypothetical protein [Solirubrobacteraceae bacterium]
MTVFDPLPRGRHKLSTEEVLASQRARLLQAMLECVGEHGYAATTVPQVVATARVSRNGFYALFTDKAECFLALCDELGEELLAEMYAFADEPDWRESVAQGTHAYLRWWQRRPAFARAYLVELPSAGPRALIQRDAQLRSYEAMFAALAARARAGYPGLPPLNPLATRLLVHGVTELVATEVREGRAEQLEALHDDLVALVCGVLG